MREYIKSKGSKFSGHQEATFDPLSSLSIKPANFGHLQSNITLGQGVGSSRKLPDPPTQRSPLDASQVKKVATPNFIQSLRSLPSTESHTNPQSFLPITSSPIIPRVKDPSLQKRQPIKFMDQETNRTKHSFDSISQDDSTDL